MRLKKRQPLHKWSPAEVVSYVEAAFYGDTEQRFVRAAAVLRYAYERMPKETIAEWQKDATEDQPDKGLPTHGVFMFDLSDDRKFALFMEHESGAVVDEVRSVHGQEEACTVAEAWVGEPCQEVPFQFLPGLYQSGLIEMITGVERDWGLYRLGWQFPGDGPYVPYRAYPPKADEPEDTHFVLMPNAVLQAQYNQFLASPTLESELRRAGMTFPK
jgi:hypothetical protein